METFSKKQKLNSLFAAVTIVHIQSPIQYNYLNQNSGKGSHSTEAENQRKTFTKWFSKGFSTSLKMGKKPVNILMT